MTTKKVAMVLIAATLILGVWSLQNVFAGKVIVQNNSQEMISVSTRSKDDSHIIYVKKGESGNENWFVISSITKISVGRMENSKTKLPFKIIKRYIVTETDQVKKFRQDYKVVVSAPAAAESDVQITLLPIPKL